MPPVQHALLGASSARRWLNCPPSARLTEHMEDSGSKYAAAGTLAHAIGELKARKYFEPMPAQAYNAALKKLKQDPGYAPEMDGATDTYLEHLKTRAMSFGSESPFVAIETRVDYSHIAPEGFGTADCIMLGSGRIEVIDYKNGAGDPVEAERNEQLMLYALGALRVFRPIYGDTIRQVHISIVQPHAGGVKEWSCTADELTSWGEEIAAPRAALAWAGEGEYRPGAWCRFCRARARCSARARELLALGDAPRALEPAKDAGPLLTDEELGRVLTQGRALSAWVKDLEAYALPAALSGRTIVGYKVVEGRGSREWTGGTDTAFPALMERGIAEALLWERKPVSVAGLEKALGKTAFDEAAGGLWEKLPGKPALVPESDRRPPYDPAAAAFEAVSG